MKIENFAKKIFSKHAKKSKGMLKRNKNNQKPYMLDKNQGCKMVYFIKIIEKIFIFLYSGVTFQNPSSRVKSS